MWVTQCHKPPVTRCTTGSYRQLFEQDVLPFTLGYHGWFQTGFAPGSMGAEPVWGQNSRNWAGCRSKFLWGPQVDMMIFQRRTWRCNQLLDSLARHYDHPWSLLTPSKLLGIQGWSIASVLHFTANSPTARPLWVVKGWLMVLLAWYVALEMPSVTLNENPALTSKDIRQITTVVFSSFKWSQGFHRCRYPFFLRIRGPPSSAGYVSKAIAARMNSPTSR